MPDEDVATAEDALLDGRVRLLQPRRGHRAGTDAVLLAAMVDAAPGETIADVGAATGAVGLMVAARIPGAEILFVERDPLLVELCRRNIGLNGLARARVVEADVLAPRPERRVAGLVAAADWVATNPPFLDAHRARLSPDARRAAAHALPPDGLDRWIAACADLLRPRGHLVAIHRADRLADLLQSVARGFGGVRLRFVHPDSRRAAIRVLVRAERGSRAPLAVEPPLVLHDATGRFTDLAEALHRGGATLA